MGSPSDAEDSGIFEDTRGRIDRAFEHLRREMREIQQQDIFLLKQLMHIRHTILLLGRHGDRRSYSIGALDPSAQEVVPPRPEVTVRSPYNPASRPLLTRVQSAPLESRMSEEIIVEEDEEDDLMESFNSTASESYAKRREFHSCSLGNATVTPIPDSDFIYAMGPLPPVFKRLLAASSPNSSIIDDSITTPNGNSATSNGCIMRNKEYYSSPHGNNFLNSSPDAPTNISDLSVLKSMARRRILQRQKSVEDYDSVGDMILDNLQRATTSTSATEVEV